MHRRLCCDKRQCACRVETKNHANMAVILSSTKENVPTSTIIGNYKNFLFSVYESFLYYCALAVAFEKCFKKKNPHNAALLKTPKLNFYCLFQSLSFALKADAPTLMKMMPSASFQDLAGALL